MNNKFREVSRGINIATFANLRKLRYTAEWIAAVILIGKLMLYINSQYQKCIPVPKMYIPYLVL